MDGDDAIIGRPVEVRCAPDGTACEEIVLRLVAADRSQREGFDAVAAGLRATARAWAAQHGYGRRDGEGEAE